MLSRYAQVAPAPPSCAQIVTGAPPLRATFRSVVGAELLMKPTQRPSGEKNGAPPLGRSLIRFDSNSLTDRRKSVSGAVPPRPALKAMCVASGEMATRLLKLGTNTPFSGAVIANCVRFRRAAPR